MPNVPPSLKNKYGPVLERLTFNLSEDVLILDEPIHKFDVDDTPLIFNDGSVAAPLEFINHDKAELDIIII